MNIFNRLNQDLVRIIRDLFAEDAVKLSVSVEFSKDENIYDCATNAALVLAKILKKSPLDITSILKPKLEELSYLESVQIAGAGFINFTVVKSEWQNYLKEILNGTYKEDYINIGQNKKVNLEYVSANPTGPVHIGHSRSAIYGDSLANLLQATGYQVDREYYINDNGNQVEILAESTYLRYRQVILNEDIEIPSGLYPGEYLIKIAQILSEKYGDSLLKLDKSECLSIIKEFAINAIMKLIKQDLLEIGVEHDIFFSERELHEKKEIDKVVNQLIDKGLIYHGTLSPPKGKKSDHWKAKEQLLFKSTLYGDDQDRPIQKDNHEWTYFAADIAYSKNKIDRGYDYIIFVLGADHGGYVKRIEAVINILSENEGKKVITEVKICQLVNFVENGKPVKMSKRAGTFTTIRDIYEQVGKDVIRFMMLTRRNDAVLDFDLLKVQEHSKDNPIFYVQYAYVRTNSVLNNAKESHKDAYQIFIEQRVNFELLVNSSEINLIKTLAMWPRIVESSSKYFEPHRIAFYLQNLAAKFHALWNLKNIDYKFIIKNDIDLTAARIALVASVQKIIGDGCNIIGVTCLTKM